MRKDILRYGLFFLMILSNMGMPHAQNFTTRLYTTADGLSDNYIFSIYQDSYGYLWIGTANGLNRFDGKKFTSFGIQQGLPSMMVDRVYEDRHHRLWIGTRAGIAELKGDSCYTYPVNDGQQITFVSSFIEPDSTKLWATTNKGLYQLRNNEWEKISLLPGYDDNLPIGKIIASKQSLFINFDNRQLIQLTREGKTNILLSINSDRPYYHSLIDVSDSIYVGTYSGLFRWTQNKWLPLFDDTLKNKYIYLSYHDRNHRWWFGTEEDGVLVAIPVETKINYIHIPLSFNLVSQFFEDSGGNIWVAGFQGLLKVSPSYYETISLPELNNMRFIRNCIAMPSGRIVVSGENGELLILKPDKLPVNAPQVITVQHLKQGDFIDHYTFDEQQRMWFTTRGGRLCRLDHNVLRDLTSIVTFKNRTFRGLAYNKQTKRLFVCGDSVLLMGNETRLDTFFAGDKKRFIPLPSTVYIQQNDGSMLVQTKENGAFLITKNGKVESLNKAINLEGSLAEDDNEKKNEMIIWAPYQGMGISRYRWTENGPPQLLEAINEKNGLSNNQILSMAVDKENKLWIATTKGITIMQENSQRAWVHQDFRMDVPGNTIPLSFTKLSNNENGKMWMDLQNKLLVFDTKKITIVSATPRTVIEKILLYNQSTNWAFLSDSVESYRSLPIKPVLRYNQNSLSIVFNGLQYDDNSDLEYSYRLIPSDTVWSSPTTGNVVSFYGLNPDHYKFEVKSHVKGFDWSEPATFSFIIKKAFWDTWWFRLVVTISAVASILFIFRYRLRQLREKTKMQNQLLELEMKALKLQMNPHFIHNALNSIQSLVINDKSNEASHYINKFAKLLRQIFENSEKNIIPLDKELSSLQLYVDLEKLRMNMDINYLVRIEDTISDSSEIKIPPLILQPFVENALWHGLSKKEGEKKLILNINSTDGWMICEITDNGIGRKKAAELYETFPEGHLSKAVNITRQRLADFNQSPDTEPIGFIDNEANGIPTGTTVIVRIKIQ